MSSHLKWHEVRDFTGGLHTVSTYLVPANAAQTMTDCYAIPEGGLRSFHKFGSLTTSGITTSGYVAVAAFVMAGTKTTSSEAPDYFLLTFNSSTSVCILYRMDTSNGATSWSALKTFSAGTAGVGITHNNFQPYTLSSGTTHLYVTMNVVGSSDAGVWRIDRSAGTTTKLTISGGSIRNLITFQDRLLVSTNEAGSARVRYSDVGSETFGVSNFIDIGPSDPSGIAFLFPYSPSDLMIAKQETAFYLLQGDLTDPIVRRQLTTANPGLPQTPAETDRGVTYQASHSGVWTTYNGAEITKLSPQLADTDIAFSTLSAESLGTPLYMGEFLVMPRGKAWSAASNSWFTVSDWTYAAPVSAAVAGKMKSNWRAVFVKQDLSAIYTWSPEESTLRRQTYTWKSPPLRDPSGRQIVVREVQVYCKTSTTGNSIIVTVNGTARTVSSIGSGAQKVTFLFREAAEELDIQVVPNSNSSSFEAPVIEAIRIGTLPGRLTDLR